MNNILCVFTFLIIWKNIVLASPVEAESQPENLRNTIALAPPTVRLDSATVAGKNTRLGHISEFLGIPFAKPPTGARRLRLPEPLPPYTSDFSATSFGFSCPQQAINLEPVVAQLPPKPQNFVLNSVYGQVIPDSEDCLYINVVKPASATPESNLPVVVWIFGGGFEIGSTNFYDGGVIVKRSIDLKSPVIYVSMNYRLAGFGFLASKEVKAAGLGNLGLHDQREALRWIQKYIQAFGGDPAKVTIWGESAGAISVSLHMLANDGNNEGLFRAGFMQSGAPIPVGDITMGQKYYDAVVSDTGCSSAPDTLECLRTIPYKALKSAINKTPGLLTYQSLNLAWFPRADGTFLTDNPQRLVQAGKVADVPFITGNCDDEGTLFSLSTLNITRSDQFGTYLSTVFLPQSIPASDINKILELYPENPTEGSPFNTSVFNAITPQFKRMAAFQGDSVFQGPRRFFLNERSDRQNSWVFLSKRFKGLPVLGSFHTTDLLNMYDPLQLGGLSDYLIRFASNLDPNDPAAKLQWPKYTTSSRKMLTFYDSLLTPEGISDDSYRVEPIAFLTDLTLEYPV